MLGLNKWFDVAGVDGVQLGLNLSQGDIDVCTSQADLLQCVTDGAVTVWQQHAEVVLGTGIRKLLHCNVVCRVLLEECCVIWIRCSILTNWNITGLAGPVASVRGVGEEVDELQGVVLTLLRDARWDSNILTDSSEAESKPISTDPGSIPGEHLAQRRLG